ncbi:hypothetical protein [Actinomadura sp. WAC 06369]|uniref:hypothetical protein n=1 Tax=Actinomadura sp. WAC 06369 TaxID=2203193 RepID=UPI000F786CEA|nr:hypothetical protein [Actinomadura sp. WAC 06369]RSN46568.1 hypothetical protein DMH08_35730 [Actinomadura sp. WAC 06369]
MTLTAITLLATLAALLYAAPMPTLAAGAALAALVRPDVTAATVSLLAAVVIAAAAVVTWRSLRDSGWRLLIIRTQF